VQRNNSATLHGCLCLLSFAAVLLWTSKLLVLPAANLRFAHPLIACSCPPDPEARLVPDGWKSTPATQSLWPSPHMMRSPCGRCHSFQVLSSLAVARMGLLGCSATLATGSRWPCRRSRARSGSM
jgi:hypothetical protein